MRTITFWLSLIMIFVIPWENAFDVAGIGTVSRAIGLIVAGFWLATVIVKGKFRKPHPFHLVVYLFVLWNVISLFWTFDTEATLDRLQTYLQLFVMVFILWDLYASTESLRAGLQAYILGAYVSVVSLIMNYLAIGAKDPFRYTGTGFNENDLGLILALGIPIAWYLATFESNSRLSKVFRVINYAFVPAAGLAIILTASRGSFVAAIPGFLFVIGSLTWVKIHLRILIFIALVVSMFALQPLVPQFTLERLATTGSSIMEGDLAGRVEIWREGLATLSQHPFLGVGSGAFRTATVNGKVAHNVFISILVETGPFGLLLFVTILGITFHQAMKQPRWEAGLWLTVLLIWLLGASVHTWEQRKQTWLVFSLLIVSAGLYAQRVGPKTHVSRWSNKPDIIPRQAEEIYLD